MHSLPVRPPEVKPDPGPLIIDSSWYHDPSLVAEARRYDARIPSTPPHLLDACDVACAAYDRAQERGTAKEIARAERALATAERRMLRAADRARSAATRAPRPAATRPQARARSRRPTTARRSGTAGAPDDGGGSGDGDDPPHADRAAIRRVPGDPGDRRRLVVALADLLLADLRRG